MDRPAAPDPALTGRFAESLAALWPGEGRLGLAVSGGGDSLALLLLADAVLPGRVEAATVDHGLRPESADEARDVARICAAMGVPHAVLAVAVETGNVQSEARAARYAALAAWLDQRGLSALATAHHADDQAETLLMRLNRGSGVAGLAGVRSRGLAPGTQAPLLRPLLSWRRSELAGVTHAAGLAPVQDPSNADDRFDRARLRKALERADWLDVPAIAASAGHLAQADAALDWAARREWAECVHKEGLGLVYRPSAPRAIALRVLARIVEELGGEGVRGSAVGRLFDALVAGQTSSIGALVSRPLHGAWTFTKAPRRRGMN